MKNNSIPSIEHVRRVTPGSVNRHSEQCGWQGVLLSELILPNTIPSEQGILPILPSYRMGLLLGGNLNINTRLEGERWRRSAFTAGGWYFIPTEREFNWSWHSDEFDSFTVLNFHLSPQLFFRAAEETLDMDSKLVEFTYRMNFHDPFLYQLAIEMYGQLSHHHAAGALYSGKLYAETAAQMLALHFLCNQSCQPRKLKTYEGGLAKHKLKLVLEYIECHLEQDLSLHTLAHIANVSAYYFSRMFKRSMGTTLLQYITSRRMRRAKFLLQQTELPISIIAESVGYHYVSHFCNAFKRIHGLSPSQYRLA